MRLLQTSCFELVAESGVSPDDFLVMSQMSLVLLHLRIKDRAVGIEPTMIGFADRRLGQLGYTRRVKRAGGGN